MKYFIEIREQLQEDVLSILDGWNVQDLMDSNDYDKMKTAICESIVFNMNKLN